METKENKFGVPGAIITAGIIIALALVYTNGKKSNGPENPVTNPSDAVAQRAQAQQKQADSLKPVSPDEHILGNPNAKVMIVEFSDIECPYCKKIHPDLIKIIDEYGKSGEVAWAYRHFPLEIHPKATPEAEATECVWAQGGNTLFWKYLDRMFEVVISNNQTDPAVPAQVAKELGVDMSKYNECMSSRTYANKVQANIQDGLDSGVNGTPYSIVIAANGKKFPINGALPYENIKTIIDLALKEK